MCVCGTVVILQFAQMDPLNPKPITRDLPSGRCSPASSLEASSGLPLAACLVISSASLVPVGS